MSPDESLPRINNLDIIEFSKIFNKEEGYSNKCVYYTNNLGNGKYVSVVDEPFDNFGYLIVGDLQLEQFVRNAKQDGMSVSLFMRGLTNKINEKFGNSKVIDVSIDGNGKIDLRKKDNAWDTIFRPVDNKQIEKFMNSVTIIDEDILSVNREGKIIDPDSNSDDDTWSIHYKESEDYIFSNFHSGWDIIMKETDFIDKYMKETAHLLGVIKYNL